MGKLLIGVLVIVGLVAIVAVGGYLVLRRADIPYESLASRYESAASRYVDLPSGVRMHYRDEGNEAGPVLLLIHGYSASLHTWEPWIYELGGDYRIVSIDLPGHGLTRAPAGYNATIENFRDAVGEFAAAQGLTRFVIGGNSMGGNVSWEYALAHPEQVDGLILIDSSGWPETRAENAEEPIIFKLLRNPLTANVLRDLDNSRLIRQGLQRSFADPTKVDEAMVTRYSELSRAPGHRDILLQLMLDFRSRNYASNERLAALTMPVLILQGAQDNLVPPDHATLFHNAIAGSELVVFDNAGHIPQEEIPAISAEPVREFVDGIYSDDAAAAQAAQ